MVLEGSHFRGRVCQRVGETQGASAIGRGHDVRRPGWQRRSGWFGRISGTKMTSDDSSCPIDSPESFAFWRLLGCCGGDSNHNPRRARRLLALGVNRFGSKQRTQFSVDRFYSVSPRKRHTLCAWWHRCTHGSVIRFSGVLNGRAADTIAAPTTLGGQVKRSQRAEMSVGSVAIVAFGPGRHLGSDSRKNQRGGT